MADLSEPSKYRDGIVGFMQYVYISRPVLNQITMQTYRQTVEPSHVTQKTRVNI